MRASTVVAATAAAPVARAATRWPPWGAGAGALVVAGAAAVAWPGALATPDSCTAGATPGDQSSMGKITSWCLHTICRLGTNACGMATEFAAATGAGPTQLKIVYCVCQVLHNRSHTIWPFKWHGAYLHCDGERRSARHRGDAATNDGVVRRPSCNPQPTKVSAPAQLLCARRSSAGSEGHCPLYTACRQHAEAVTARKTARRQKQVGHTRGIGADGGPGGARGTGADGCGTQELGAPSRPGIDHLWRAAWHDVAT